MKKITISAFALVAAFAFGGCATAPDECWPVDTRVTVAEDLGRAVYVRDARCAKVNGSQFATFQATVVNNTSRNLSVEWKVEWLDAAGFAVEGLTSTWRNAALAPRDHRALKGVAPSPEAVDMRFYVRRLRR